MNVPANPFADIHETSPENLVQTPLFNPNFQVERIVSRPRIVEVQVDDLRNIAGTI